MHAQTQASEGQEVVSGKDTVINMADCYVAANSLNQSDQQGSSLCGRAQKHRISQHYFSFSVIDCNNNFFFFFRPRYICSRDKLQRSVQGTQS